MSGVVIKTQDQKPGCRKWNVTFTDNTQVVESSFYIKSRRWRNYLLRLLFTTWIRFHFPSHFSSKFNTSLVANTENKLGALPIFTPSHTWPIISESGDEFSVLKSCENWARLNPLGNSLKWLFFLPPVFRLFKQLVWRTRGTSFKDFHIKYVHSLVKPDIYKTTSVPLAWYSVCVLWGQSVHIRWMG